VTTKVTNVTARPCHIFVPRGDSFAAFLTKFSAFVRVYSF